MRTFTCTSVCVYVPMCVYANVFECMSIRILSRMRASLAASAAPWTSAQPSRLAAISLDGARRAMSPKAVPVVPEPTELVRDTVVVRGGLLGSRQWVYEPAVINGKEFLVLNRKDRELCKFLGYDVTKGSPMTGALWKDQLAVLRNVEVDRLIALNKPQDSRRRL